jgi:hypothetical protein
MPSVAKQSGIELVLREREDVLSCYLYIIMVVHPFRTMIYDDNLIKCYSIFLEVSFEFWSCLPSCSPQITSRLNSIGLYEVPWLGNAVQYEFLMRFTMKVVHKSEQFLYFYIIFKLTNLGTFRCGIIHIFSWLVCI